MKRAIMALVAPGLLMGAAFVAPTTPAVAQSADEDIVITGHWHRVRPEDAETASQRVSYADLDLSTDWGRHELRHRLKLTARYVCDRLGESDTGSVGPTCRDAAYKDAVDRLGTIEAHFAPRGTAWVRPAGWRAPYADDWASRYPDDGN